MAESRSSRLSKLSGEQSSALSETLELMTVRTGICTKTLRANQMAGSVTGSFGLGNDVLLINLVFREQGIQHFTGLSQCRDFGFCA